MASPGRRRSGLTGKDWTPRELEHRFVSLLSHSGVPVEQISRLVGGSGTTVTELVYRKQIRPALDDAAPAMDRIFQLTGVGPCDGREWSCARLVAAPPPDRVTRGRSPIVPLAPTAISETRWPAFSSVMPARTPG